MKKSILALFTLPFFTLASCAPKVASSESDTPISEESSLSEDVSSSSKSSSSTSVNKVTIQNVIDQLNHFAMATSYQVDYLESDGNDGTLSLTDIYTPNYISIGFMNGGYLTLPSANPNLGEKIVYSFKYTSNKEIVLGKAISYYDADDQLKPVNSCVDLDYLKLFNTDTYRLKQSSFNQNGASITTSDEHVLYVLSHLMGYDSDLSSQDINIISASFTIENGELTFSLFKQLDTDSNATELLITSTLRNFNAVQDTQLQNYIDQYVKPTISPTDAIKNKFKADYVGFATTIQYATSNGWSTFGETEVVSYYDKQNPKNNKMKYRISDSVNHEEYSYVLTVGDNNLALDHYIDGFNQVQSEIFDNTYYWGNGIFSIQKENDIDSFFDTDGNGNYSYLGINADRLFESIAALTVLTDLNIKEVVSMAITNEGDNLLVTTLIDGFYYGEDGSEVQLSMKATSSWIDNAVIEMPKSYETTDETTHLQQIINNSFTHSFVADGHGLKSDGSIASTLPSNTYYFKKDSYFLFREKNRGNYRETIRGYKKLNNGIVEFTVDRHGIVTQVGDVLTDKSLKEFIPWNLNTNVLRKGSDKNYFLQNHVKHVYQNVFGGSTLDSMIDTSFKLSINDQNLLDSISYSYVYAGLLSGKEELKFSYSEEMALPEFVNEDSFAQLDGNHEALTNWTEEKDTNIAKAFTKRFGDDAKKIPYLYDADISESWYLGTNYDGTNDLCVYSTKVKGTDFMDRYKAQLISDGYVTKDIDGYTYYAKDEIGIRFGSKESDTADYSNYLYFRVIQ